MKYRKRFREMMAERMDGLSEDRMTTWRAESIEAVVHGIAALRLDEIVAAYLDVTFNVAGLGDLSDDDLRQAMRFISAMFDRAARETAFPMPEGTEADGEIFWLRGKFRWGGGVNPAPLPHRFGME